MTVAEVPACIEHTSSTSAHEAASRARSETTTSEGWWWNAGTTTTTWYAIGSDTNLGTAGSTVVTLKEQPIGYFEVGTCPAGPVAPSIDTYAANVDGYDVVISGTASDADNDIEQVVLSLNGTDYTCTGTTSWSCSFTNLQPASYTAIIKAIDSRDAESPTVTTSFVIAAPTAPVVTLTNSSVQGGLLHINGTVSDVNGDVTNVYLGFPPAFGNDCGTAANVSCDLDVSNLEPGNYLAQFYAIDAENLESNVIDINFTITDGIAPVITNVNYSVNNKDMTVTANVTDEDGDLASVRLEYSNDIGQIECTGTSLFTCDLDNHPLGTYSFIVAAYDEAGHRSISYAFEATFTEGPTCITAANSEHIDAGRATLKYGLLTYANGSNAYLGFASATTSLEETAPGVWNTCNP